MALSPCKKISQHFFVLILIVTVPLLHVCVAGAGEDQVNGLTFKNAVQTALKQNPDILSADAAIRNSEAMTQKTSAGFMPVVDIYTDYITGDAPSSALFTSIDKRELSPSADFNRPGVFRNFESGIRAQMTLFNGGRNCLARQASADFLAAAKAGRRAVVNSVIGNVMQLWFQIVSADRFIRISEETVDNIRRQLDIMSVRFQGGSVLKSDILSLKVRLAEAEEELIRNRSKSSVAKASLAVLLGKSPGSDLVVNTTNTDFTMLGNTIKNALNGMASNQSDSMPSDTMRPEIVQLEKIVSGSQKNVARAKRIYLPSVQLVGKYYMDDADMHYDTDRDNWTAGVMMNWNLFSGFADIADRKKAAAEYQAALQEKRKTDLAVALDEKKSRLILEEASARLDVSGKNKELAEESLSLVKKQYEGGSATVTRYLDAELALSKAKTRLATAMCDQMSAVVETARAKGLLSDPGFIFEAPVDRERKTDENQ
jgi:outer membrane protein TolC